MASKTAMIWYILIFSLSCTSCQRLGSNSYDTRSICKNMFCNSLDTLLKLENCVVVVGNLSILLPEWIQKDSLMDISFPELREVTGYMVVYRVAALESLGQLFPNLARIRGAELINNYGLIVYDMFNLREIGLYSLLKVDRGGVIIWGGPQTCYVDTVDWKTIAPKTRHIMSPPDIHAHCNKHCTCSRNISTNHCWNNRRCQRFLDGPDGEKCNKECLGCKKTDPDDCSVCRHYTYRRMCVSQCPVGTLILPINKYCVTIDECRELKGYILTDKSCVFECPVDFVADKKWRICKPCFNCQKTCSKQIIQSLYAIQAAQHCVYINGSLMIQIQPLPDAMSELRKYLNRVEEVTDYIIINSSASITSLDFLSSLKRIRGRNLLNGRHSLVVYDMLNLRTLFTSKVSENLKVDRGAMNIYNNPVLCVSHIEKLNKSFPVQISDLDIPQGMNGYRGGCAQVQVDFQIRITSETSAKVIFSSTDPEIYYSILYVRIPPGNYDTFVPETCSESEWNTVNVPTTYGHFGIVELTSLRPASNYAVCVETFDPLHKQLARSSIVNFSTPIGKPAPPFIYELVASTSDVVVLHWVDHRDYRPYIIRYELDVAIIDIHPKDIVARNHCVKEEEEYEVIDYSRHAVLMKPPPEYDRGCESMCGILSSVTSESVVKENFDICNSLDFGCDNHEEEQLKNSTLLNYVQTIVLNISGPRNDFQVGDLAPFRDYRFRLRACTSDQCSRSTRGVIRTMSSQKADIPSLTYVFANNTGHIKVKWKPPAVTNGPILSYTLQVMPQININELSYLIPQSWCVLANELNLIVKSEVVSQYFVRICARTLASSNACSDWKKVMAVKENRYSNWSWIGVIFGLLLYVTSIGMGYLKKSRRDHGDDIPLLDDMSSRPNESEPISLIMSNYVEYSIPLRDTLLE